MKTLTGTRTPILQLDSHIHICDLIYLEGSVLSLFRDEKQNWLYLWCDTDGELAERWLVFPVTRSNLVAYLGKHKPLKDLVVAAARTLVLETQAKEEFDANGGSKGFSTHRKLMQIASLDVIAEYLPTSKSYFDEELAPDIELTKEINPESYDVPIDGQWFLSDLDRFSNVYSQLYAFFYCTKPRFVANIGEKVKRYLSSPWTGGYSRINLFDALKASVPSLHDLEIKRIQYASPGEIRIEALSSVGASVADAVKRYLATKRDVEMVEKKINTLLSSKQLKKKDLSAFTNEKLPIAQSDVEFFKNQSDIIANMLGVEEEFHRLNAYSPNAVVAAKVLLALVSRVRRIAEFEHDGLLDLNRPSNAIGANLN